MSTFTDAQIEAFGQIVADNFGANIQTGFWRESTRAAIWDGYEVRQDLEGVPYVTTQMGPNQRAEFWLVKDDGKVVQS